MDVKEAVQTAKRYLGDLYAEENPVNIGLEEVEFDYDHDMWRVTIGFSRPWELNTNFMAAVGGTVARRAYKVVTISDKENRVVSVKDREIRN